jgi:hypothetical protein
MRLFKHPLKRLLATGASDDEVLDWVNSHGTPKTSAEIDQFSNSFEKIRPYDDPELRELFEETYRPLGLDPKTSTIADIWRRTIEYHLRNRFCSLDNRYAK